ncbi:hypothetical protein EJ05DRAFT_444658 [Pseudovirgaria hyperparasitica]|uniref:histidine kinase n=1 Tax=Pseudovirgaria hyperparasitica TaxID=470096 RepID=A0A6A6VWR4_9PEZI|nr:uncharacterized protein EJ05DRAFT_444658 [Pseudovirgaria hyperparasitica]KAF2753697.1 hypothetical protein EJ05DRAFT_444658 [Pseudovirgaria hyperparasitica]
MKKSSPLPSPKSTKPSSTPAKQRSTTTLTHNAQFSNPLSHTQTRPRLRREARKSSSPEEITSLLEPTRNSQANALSSQHATLPRSNISTTSESADEDTEDSFSGPLSDVKEYEEGKSPEHIEIERLKEALSAKMAANQQRAISSMSPKQSPGGRTPVSVAARRVSPIKEEITDMSPSLEASFSSPPPSAGLHTASTESTESVRTIKGSVPPTPSALPLRTPSYPFPYVPGTPRTWSSSFHQPFTNLSPTIDSLNIRGQPTVREQFTSGDSTPAASVSAFLPPSNEIEDPRYPSPNLYDTILLLNSEPGLEAWWSTVVKLCHEWFGAERASLSVPADASDQNVPWTQQATYNASGRRIAATAAQTSSSIAKASDLSISRSPEEATDLVGGLIQGGSKRRPKLEARHSYAGPERQRKDATLDTNKAVSRPERPGPPSRTASHVPRTLTRGEHPLRHVSPVSYDGARSPSRGNTFSDPEFSSPGDASDRPCLLVYPQKQPLNVEQDPLIDDAGVNRILEKGRLVTLTRDYSVSWSSESSPEGLKRSQLPKNAPGQSASLQPQRQTDVKDKPNHPSRTTKLESHSSKRTVPYEEYEQLPSSPWAQSPHPSPAVQNDPNEDPFFGQTNVDDTFDPTSASGDYSGTVPVEAIGVDRASTITHVPLIHPLLSQVVHPSETSSFHHTTHTDLRNRRYRRSSKASMPNEESSDRKVPIAILSFMSSEVPFPQNWTNSLKLLAPHLATTYSNAAQFSEAFDQAQNLRLTRFQISQTGYTPMTNDSQSLHSLLRLDLGSYQETTPGETTSPSDYSGHSRPSPGSTSMVGTPGWDTSMYGVSGRHSVVGTPAQISNMDAIDSYFDSKKIIMGAKSSQSSQPVSKSPSVDRALSRKKLTESGPVNETDDAITPKDSQKSDYSREDPRKPVQAREAENKKHSLLHSYGANFSSSFHPLPTATTPRTPGLAHNRKSSASEIPDLVQPSSTLLRTIIDSLPVQIFTAAPATGNLTWVNSKFLVYRGQSPKQALQEPWNAIHEEDRDGYMEQWHRSLRTGAQLAIKVRLLRFDGTYRWFFVRAAPLKDKRQNIVHWMGTNMDFHDQHLAEMNSARQQEVAASEAKYRALANSSPQIVFAATQTKGVIFCNSQWVVFSGQSESEASGVGFMNHVHPDDISKCRLPTFDEDGSAVIDAPITVHAEGPKSPSPPGSEASSETERITSPSPGNITSPSVAGIPQARLSRLASAGITKMTKDLDGRPSYATEVRLRSKDGIYRWHLVRILLAEPVFKDGNEEDTWYGTCTDINDHKLLEATLKETMDAKTRFLSNMSHEIRTPLNGITGMVNFLIDSSLTAEQMEHINIIRSSTEGLRDLINDILDLSKVEAGMITLSPQWFSVRELIEDVNDLTSGMAVEKGLQLNYVLEPDVPHDLKGDKFRIRQVLLNVIGNAIKFTDTGEVFMQCRVASDTSGVELPKDNEILLQFQVIDTGKGFTEKEAEFLFKRFSQIDGSSTRQHGGTGLGLAISMQLVELHGGKMKASSVPGKGSTFTFTVKFQFPSGDDRPSPGTAQEPYNLPTPFTDEPPRIEKKFSVAYGSPGHQLVESPMSHASESPAPSSASSDPSVRTIDSVHSQRSSVSSFSADKASLKPITLSMPAEIARARGSIPDIKQPLGSPLPAISSQPPMYSILVVCPLEYSSQATVKHLESTLPTSIPHQITARESLEECKQMLGGEDPVLFTHVVLVLRTVQENVEFIDQVLRFGPAHSTTTVVVVCDLTLKREIIQKAPYHDFDRLKIDARLVFIFKPLKPSKISAIFDPRKERGMLTDRSHDNAQQVAVSQKQVFEELKRRLGNRGLRVLLVEDNQINQTVLLKFLGKIDIDVETVLDGVQCTDKVFAHPHGYYSIILCDLHMPNKDGYQTCREIRKWEKRNKFPYLPIIALSANVLGDVYTQCVDAGFNSYVTKPVDFKVLSGVMNKFLDPEDKTRPIEFMKPLKKG